MPKFPARVHPILARKAIYENGRHTRGAGYAADLAKYLEASLAGWHVVRLGQTN